MRAERGFTLIEMMVALSIFGLIAASGSVVLSGSLRAQSGFEEADLRLKRFQQARSVLRRDFAQIIPRTLRDERGAIVSNGFRATNGDRGQPLMAFVRSGWTNPDGRAERGALQYVEYRLENGALIRRSASRIDAVERTPVQDRELLTGVRTLRLRYYARGQFSDNWEARSGTGFVPRYAELVADIEGIGEVRQLFLTSGDPK
ncbi:MAG: type II secretion system minor pseudopilin GspJ [Pseudomonadota bacterium]